MAVVGALGASAFALVNSDDPNGASPGSLAPKPGQNAAVAFVGGEERLILSKGHELLAWYPDTGEREAIAAIPATDAVASPGSELIAYVAAGSGEVDPDFVKRPALHLFDPADGSSRPLGSGVAPMWSATGAGLAYLRPTEARGCDGERCKGATEVVLYEPADDETTVLSEPGGWALLGWVGDRVLASEESDLSVSHLLSPERDEELEIEPSEFWDASPDGAWIIRVDRTGAASFVAFREGRLGRAIDIELNGAAMADGAWSHDSKRVALALVTPRGSSLALVSPQNPAPVTLDASKGAVGPVLWGPEGDEMLVVSGYATRRLLSCPLDGACRRLMVLGDGELPLRVE